MVLGISASLEHFFSTIGIYASLSDFTYRKIPVTFTS